MSPLGDYIQLTRYHARFLLFGFLMAFVSSAGQTYFIGIFGPEIRASFELTHTEWGTIYLIGTLCSALLLPWSGQIIDRVDLRWFSVFVLAGLVAACLTVSFAESIVALTIAIFLLRQFGQGLVSHASITSMARYMNRNRGKSIAIASMGYSTGEAVLPLLAVLAVMAIGWRASYQLTAFIVALAIPLMFWTLRGHHHRHTSFLAEENSANNADQARESKTQVQMLLEPRFYLLLPAVMAPAIIGTALFFHHLTLAEFKQWSPVWVTGSYWIYALTTVITGVMVGPVIDRYSATRVLPWYLVPLIAALLLLIPAIHTFWIIPYMILLGINTGIYFTGLAALWAEIYGPKFLGGIKSVVGAINVFGSALGPVSIGLVLDAGYTFNTVCILFAIFSLVSTVMLVIGLRRYTS